MPNAPSDPTPGYELVEQVRDLDIGDEIRVWYQRDRFHDPEHIDGVVTDTSPGEKPLIDVRPADEPEDSNERFYLETAGRHQSGYKVRDIGSDHRDGSDVYALEDR